MFTITKKIIQFSLIALLSFSIVSCDKDNDDDNIDNSPTTKNVNLKVDLTWGPNYDDFALNTKYFHSAAQDTISISLLKLYISNVELIKEDGSSYIFPESYFLVDAEDENSHNITLPNVPNGTYKAVKFMIGVDSLRNVSGAQTGVLSTSNGMFWSWNSGYIFAKAEGFAAKAPEKNFIYHLGGFSGENACNLVNTFTFPNNLSISTGASNPEINLQVNAARFWHGGVNTAEINKIHMPGPDAKMIMEKFFGGFRVSEVK
jgi:hypothetical protein